MKVPQFFREIFFELKWMIEDISILIKHPSRKLSRIEVKYHFFKLYRTIFSHPWYCLKRGIRNLYTWFPIIWRNDVWDHDFICVMIDKQLKEMEDFWKKQAEEERTSNWNMDKGYRCQNRRIYKRIKWCCKYMDMWREEHYIMKAYDENVKLFPRDSNKLFDHDESLTTYDEYGIPLTYTCKPMAEDCAEDYRMRSTIAHEQNEKVFKLWLKQLSYLRNWWHVFIFFISIVYFYNQFSNIL